MTPANTAAARKSARTRAIEPACYRADDLVILLGLSVRTIKRLLQDGQLASFKIGRSRLVSREAVTNFLRAKKAALSDG